ncbi:unnamed protein product [Protopolystoma xenopodis]|uniref:Uncharacterized protein n=1 Tax=Protopolystoma xenopodis TaxID=117903 RepID=A0A3S5BCV4_9PLAT|nr:unnamed protein product [Protopolystoma xenopodis]
MMCGQRQSKSLDDLQHHTNDAVRQSVTKTMTTDRGETTHLATVRRREDTETHINLSERTQVGCATETAIQRRCFF